MKILLEFEASIQYWRAKYSRQLGCRSPCKKIQRNGAHPQGFCWVLANKGMLHFTRRNLGRSYFLLLGGKLSFEAIGAISSFIQTHYTTSIQQEIKLGKAGSCSLPWVYMVIESCIGGVCIHRLFLWQFRYHFYNQGEVVFVLSSSR